MKATFNRILLFSCLMALLVLAISCNTGKKSSPETNRVDTISSLSIKGTEQQDDSQTDTLKSNNRTSTNPKSINEKVLVLIYNFHLTNRCPSCIA